MSLPLRSPAFFAAALFGASAWIGLSAGASAHPSAASTSAEADAPAAASSISIAAETVVLPGPLRPFLRMAGISQEVAPDDVLPMLARNVTLWGYDGDHQTEYLVLADRYLRLARELEFLADPSGTIRVSNCDEATRLVQILGYRFQPACGQRNAALITASSERAFLTVDSGFPLTALEQDLQKGRTFAYSFPPTQIPILLTEKNWQTASAWKSGNLVDVLLHDPDLDHLYLALSRIDDDTRASLLRSPGLRHLISYANLLDMYGSRICIRSGEVMVPGGAGAGQAWEQLVGASPNSPGDFIVHLLAKDHGWLVAYFDALSRVDREQQARLTQGSRLRAMYEAYRSTAPTVSATAGVFPKNADLLMLLTRLQWQENGEPEIPGGLAPWQEILNQETRSSGLHQWARHVRSSEGADRVLEGLVASSNRYADANAMQIYLTLSAIDSRRPPASRLSEDTVRLLAGKWTEFSSWYPVFADFPELDDGSVAHFVSAAEKIDAISNPTLRSNALGSFQAVLGIWQILARQQEIPGKDLNATWHSAVQPFQQTASSAQLFEAARASLKSVVTAAGGDGTLSQDQIVDLLAGPAQQTAEGRHAHQQIADRMRAVLEDQRLATIDALFGLDDGLTEMAHSHEASLRDGLLPLAGSLREFEMPRPIFTEGERAAWSPQIYSSRHAELEIRTDLAKVIRSQASPAQLEAARGWLTPFLRDTLVGLNYAYYEPPGAQVLHNNPLFVRSHDFSGGSIQGLRRIWGNPDLIGIGATAGGGAYLIGSLSGLPYALASTEGDFISPEKVQALIWKETVPELLVDSVLPRWWTITPDEMHAAALYQRAGEELLQAAASDAQLRSRVVAILSNRIPPGRLDRIGRALEDSESAAALIPRMTPAETFYLAIEMRKDAPLDSVRLAGAGRELEELARKDPSAVDPKRLSIDFGVPHPTLSRTDACALLNTGVMPAFGGDASTLFGESWESNNLYWARLADEMHYPPVMLNILVPALTRRMVANIFATNIDDWPALLRSLKETGDEFRQGKITVEAAETIARE
ncbi:MAG TPA: hypothetical protein VLZ50_03850 [Terracidiphilus sp.]|nr:hypothetical protein [Terracidiphilus sp.]